MSFSKEQLDALVDLVEAHKEKMWDAYCDERDLPLEDNDPAKEEVLYKRYSKTLQLKFSLEDAIDVERSGVTV